MEFEWDETKRHANIEKHGLDFRDAKDIWRKPVVDPAAERFAGAEYRPLALGVIGEDEIIIAVVYTPRGEVTRIISARRARSYERKIYQDRFGRGL